MGIPDNERPGAGSQRKFGAEGVISGIAFDARAKLQAHHDAPLKPPAQQQRDLTAYFRTLDSLASEHEFLDLGLAQQLAQECEALLDLLNNGTSEQTHRLVQMAVSYFIDPNDAEDDTDSPIGFDDDAEVIRAVARELGVNAGEDV